MRIVLRVIAGPHKGLEFTFDRHDTFLVGRSQHAHFQLPAKDKYFSRVHFMMEVNPPACRLIDMGSHNGTFVNGEKTFTADLKDGDQIRAGHTILRLQVEGSRAPAMPSTVTFEAALLPTVPGYLLERELGSGAMGTTYLGQRVGAESAYAIKVVKPNFAGSPEQIADFLRTARSLVALDHPNLVRLRDVGACPAGYFFASDLVIGRSAADVLRHDGPLAIRRAIRWAQQILRALQYAHGLNVIHRDIKPTNLLITDVDGKEVAQLADYGVARVYQAAPFSGLSLTTGLLELASFIPPEVLFNYQEANPLADQYSVAAVIYHLLTGAPVLEVPTEDHQLYSSLLRPQYLPLRTRRPEVPDALADVIHKALSRTPNQRFGSSAAFSAALGQAFSSSEPEA